jgi:AraC-like DNA-binding protein
MELDDATLAALAQAAAGEGISVRELLERLVLAAARHQLQVDMATIDAIAADAQFSRRKTACVLPFRRVVARA